MIIKILLLMGVIVLAYIISLNIVFCFISLGMALEEKYSNRKSIFEIIGLFWLNFWRRIIK